MNDTTPAWAINKNAKLGLALSGGGFRASLYHIGVLASLAERDLLREIEVISTVSGGSIIGALYYLKIKELLENKRKDGLRPNAAGAYLTIIKEIENDFLSAVQKNIRMRTFLNPYKNIKMLRADYSRSDRIAELYTRYFYQSVWDNINQEKGKPVFLKDLKIYPADDLWPETMKQEGKFDFHAYQKKSPHKIPVLILNATSLNTGHCWQFTASWVGEKARTRTDFPVIDINTELKPLYFDDAALPEKVKNKINTLELGDAVASSACVPIIFQPFAIHDLYTVGSEEYVVQLVDGGVFDNQGIYTALNDQRCGRIICSDASSQMEDMPKPLTGSGSVIQRTNDILMDRVRDCEINDLFDKPVDKVFLHLRDKRRNNVFPGVVNPQRNELIDSVAAIRTDLDSFHDVEAYSLMYTGYKMCEDKMNIYCKKAAPVTTGNWNFFVIENKASSGLNKLLKFLKVSKEKAFKVFMLSMPLKIVSIAIAAYLGFLLFQSIYQHDWTIPEISTRKLVVSLASFIVLFLIGKLLGKWAKKIIHFIQNLEFGLWRAALLIVIPYVGAVLFSFIVLIHLLIFDCIYLKLGKTKANRTP